MSWMPCRFGIDGGVRVHEGSEATASAVDGHLGDGGRELVAGLVALLLQIQRHHHDDDGCRDLRCGSHSQHQRAGTLGNERRRGAHRAAVSRHCSWANGLFSPSQSGTCVMVETAALPHAMRWSVVRSCRVPDGSEAESAAAIPGTRATGRSGSPPTGCTSPPGSVSGVGAGRVRADGAACETLEGG